MTRVVIDCSLINIQPSTKAFISPNGSRGLYRSASALSLNSVGPVINNCTTSTTRQN